MAISKQFVLAGDATFTIETPDGHHTFKVQHVEATDRWQESYFVKMLVGADNTADYAYIGKLDAFTGQVATTAKSKLPQEHRTIRVLNRILARVWCDDHNAYEQHGYATHHEGKCGRCGRKLTTPASVKSGIGPECAKIMQCA